MTIGDELRKEIELKLEKHPGHEDQSVHDPKGGKGKGPVGRVGNAIMSRMQGLVNRMKGEIPVDRAREYMDSQRAKGSSGPKTIAGGHDLQEVLQEESQREGDEMLARGAGRSTTEAEMNDPDDEWVQARAIAMDNAMRAGAPPPKASTPTVLWHGTAKEHMDLVLKDGLQTAKILGRAGAGWGYDVDADGEADDVTESTSEAHNDEQGSDEQRATADKVDEMKQWVKLNPDLAQSRANSVYLAKDESTAERYAYDSAKRAGSDQVGMVQVTIPADVTVKNDEFWKGAYRLEGSIPPSWITGYKSGTVHPNGIAWANLMETGATALKMLTKAALGKGKTVFVPIVFAPSKKK